MRRNNNGLGSRMKGMPRRVGTAHQCHDLNAADTGRRMKTRDHRGSKAKTHLLRFIGAVLTAALVIVSGTAHAAETVTYYHNDALGSPVAATDAQGNLLWREHYQPYGSRIEKEPAADGNTRWYTGHQQDADTGLVYMGARFYDPVLGRFMAVDPVGVQRDNIHTFNRYAYAANNPYKYVDPDGRLFWLVVIPAAASPEVLAAVGIVGTVCLLGPCGDAIQNSLESVADASGPDNHPWYANEEADGEQDSSGAGNVGPHGGARSDEDQTRLDKQRKSRNERRERKSRQAIGQNQSGKGFREEGRKKGKKGSGGKKPKGPGGRNRERNIGIDEEHSRVPKGFGGGQGAH